MSVGITKRKGPCIYLPERLKPEALGLLNQDPGNLKELTSRVQRQFRSDEGVCSAAGAPEPIMRTKEIRLERRVFEEENERPEGAAAPVVKARKVAVVATVQELVDKQRREALAEGEYDLAADLEVRLILGRADSQ